MSHYQALAAPSAVRCLLASMTEDEFLRLILVLHWKGSSLREHVGALAAKAGELHHVELFALEG